MSDDLTLERLLAEGSWLEGLARRLTGGGADGDDALQDSWVAALEHPPAAGRPLRPWLARVLRNATRRRHRGELRRARREREHAAPEVATPAELALEVEQRVEVARAVLALAEPYRRTVLLHHYRGLPVEELARREGVTPAAVRQRLSRARAELRARLERRGLGGLLAAGAGVGAPAPRVGPWLAAVGGRRALLGALALIAGLGLWWAVSARPPAPPAPPAPPGGALVADRDEGPAEGAGPVHPRAVGRDALPAPATAPQPGRLEVVALDAGGRPVPGTWIRVEAGSSGSPWPQVECAAADASGRARFDLAPGPVRCRAFGGVPRDASVRAGEETRLALEVPATLAVRGRVVDAAGRPVAGAEVWSSAGVDPGRGQRRHGPEGPGGGQGGAVVARTDSAGAFRLARVATDQALGARAAGFAPSPLQLPRGCPGQEVSMTLELRAAGLALRGRVLDDAGAPLAGARVEARELDAPEQLLADGRPTGAPPPQARSTDATGAFAFEALAAGGVLVRVRAAGFALREERVELPRAAALELRLVPGPHLTGRALDAAGRPVAGALVRVEGHGGGPLAVTDAEGGFELGALPLGTVRVTAEHPSAGAASTTLELAAGASARWEARLRARPVLRGRLVDAGGLPLAGWELSTRIEGRPEREERIGRTDSSGGFELPCDPGPQRVHAYELAAWAGFPPLIVRGVDPDDGPHTLVVPAPGEQSGTLVGRVLGPDGEGTDAALVSVWHQVHKIWRGAVPGPDGRFRIEHLPRGDVTLDVNPDDYPWIGLGEPEIEIGAVLDVGDVRLEAGGSVRGRLLGLDDERARAARVSLEGAETLLTDGQRMERGDGGRGFSIGPLRAGDYTLAVEGDGLVSARVGCAVRAGLETRVDVELAPAGTRALVLELAGRPLPHAVEVELLEAGRAVWQGWGTTDTEGPLRLRVSAVPGRYELRIGDRYGDQVLYAGPLSIETFDDGGPELRIELRPQD